jgi:hypothetical protein
MSRAQGADRPLKVIADISAVAEYGGPCPDSADVVPCKKSSALRYTSRAATESQPQSVARSCHTWEQVLRHDIRLVVDPRPSTSIAG